MLVGYSSSSEEEDGKDVYSKSALLKSPEDGSDGPVKKRPRTEEKVTKTRLPLPGSLMTMFSDDEEPKTEDSSLHGGRVRSFKHERGNWATYVYLPYHPEEEFLEVMEDLITAAASHGVVLTPQEEFHLSLSQTVVLRHHWIQPFTQSLRTHLAPCKRCMCTASKLKIYCNAEKTRTFLGIEVCYGQAHLLELVRVIDRTMAEFQLDPFYKEPSFHVSLAWCVGDQTEKMKGCLWDLQCVIDNREEGTFVLRMDGAELRCKTGNKIFRFPLEQ